MAINLALPSVRDAILPDANNLAKWLAAVALVLSRRLSADRKQA